VDLRALFLAVLLLPTVSCATLAGLLQRPTVSFVRMDLTAVGFQGASARFTFAVQNPNGFGLHLARLGYAVTLDGRALAEGQGDAVLDVPARGEGELRLPLTIRYADAIAALEQLITRERLPYSLATRLGFDSPAGTIEVPVATSGELPVPRLPKVALGGVRLAGLGAEGVRVRVELALSNPNPWPLPLGALRYRVRVAGGEALAGEVRPPELGAGSAAVVPVEVTLRPEGAAAAFGALRAGDASAALEGELELGDYRLPLRLGG
jgi:LEA14-like dessication related protein